MKIGIVCYPTVGGSGILATELGHELANRGHEVHFITYEVPFRLRMDEQNIHFHEVEINAYQLFRYPDYALPLAVKIADVIKQHDLDILHVHYAIPHATSAYMAKQILGNQKVAVITTLHGTDITLVGRDPAYYEIVKFSIEHSDGVTAVSHKLREQTMEYFGISKPIKVIHNFFIPKPELIGKKPQRDEKVLLHSSNYRSVKRAEDVLNIFLEVRKEIKCKLLFVGTGAALGVIRQRVSELGLDDQVNFVGENRMIDSYIADSDLFLLPSEQESFGLAALEAMAYGVPVVASDVGGLPEVIAHGKTGYLAPVGDVRKMAQYAIDLLTNANKYQKMSKEGINVAQQRFNVSKILPQYEEYYQAIMEKL